MQKQPNDSLDGQSSPPSPPAPPDTAAHLSRFEIETLQRLERVETALGHLVDALAIEPAEEEQPEGRTLDGDPAGRERDQTQSLG